MNTHQFQISDVSIIVAARNEGGQLEKCIDSLLVAAQGKAEILIVDDGSMDNSLEILKKYGAKIRFLEGEGKGPGKARNLGLQTTKKTYIAFTDADCVVAPNWLEVLVQSMQGKSLTLSSVGGIQKISREAGPFEKNVGEFFETIGFVSDYVHSQGITEKVLHNPTCNVLYSREALEKAGGFDETLWPCEDLDLDLRLKKLGFEALFNPLAQVEHRRPGSPGSLMKMMKRYGFAHAQLVKKHGFCQKIHWLVFSPLFLVALIFINALPFLITFPFLFFWLKSFSFSKGAKFTSMFFGCTTLWVFGFYSGLIGSRRVAKAHG